MYSVYRILKGGFGERIYKLFLFWLLFSVVFLLFFYVMKEREMNTYNLS